MPYRHPAFNLPRRTPQLKEGRRSRSREDLSARTFGNPVRKGELELLAEELLDIRPFHVIRLFQFDNLEDLHRYSHERTGAETCV